MSFSIRSADYHREGGDMVSQPPGSPREELPDDDAQYAAFVDEMPAADAGKRECCRLTTIWYREWDCPRKYYETQDRYCWSLKKAPDFMTD